MITTESGLLTERDSFQKMLEKIYTQNNANDPAQKGREKAWQRFQELGLPTRKTEAFQYLRLRALYTRSFEKAPSPHVNLEALKNYILPECAQSVLIFINGRYRSELSQISKLPKRLVILPLAEANRTYGNFLNNQWNKLLKEENDSFSLLNAALYEEGLFIYAPPKTILDVPIQLLHVTSLDDTPQIMNPHVQCFVGAQSQINLISTQAHLSGAESLLNAAVDVSIEEDAHVRYVQVPSNLLENTWHFDTFRATLKRNSTLKTILATEGSVSQRYDYRIALMGENAEAILSGISMLSKNHEAHSHILMEHQAPYCRSNQLFKSVLNDASRSSFEGKILVRQAAQKTEAFQLNNNLLLSDKAKADSKPNLEIFADDVKASHGATVGQLDDEQLFYLRTRGYPEQAAKNLLVYAFCKEVFDLIPYPSLTKSINQRAQRYLDSRG
jgi:Fe-S cluster assembly protein SufD